ncbi:MAG: peptidylprolyl isomerase [Thermodesulfobacteriota bacterium]|nr:peptidylprolyl isomerase [Thermodesulfobacteriota bacterium]
MAKHVRKLLKEPLFHFLAIGAGLFLLSGLFGGSSVPQPGQKLDRIVVTRGQIDHLTARFTRTWQRPPTEKEVKGLIDEYVLDEISYREALALGLDRDDPTIRRRLRLKLETLNEDIAAATLSSDQELKAFLESHPDSFRRRPQVAFRQVYLSPDRRGRKTDADARNLLARLRAAGPDASLAGKGDSLMMLSNDLPLSTEREVGRLFGEEFAGNVLSLAPGRWEGPVRSGYGLHLVLVTERTPGRLPELSEVRAEVEREWSFARKKEIQDAMHRKLRERYTVVVEQPPDPGGKGSAIAATIPGAGGR